MKSIRGLSLVVLLGFGACAQPATTEGGNPGQGGAEASGGETGTGGASGTGGSETGGSVGSGGAGTGGVNGTGGTVATGGVTGTGGTKGTGGVNGTGGVAGTGGTPATGGATGTGGTKGTGGAPATGGTTGTGGMTATGGTKGTGGTPATGGTTGTGGMTATGGATGTGGTPGLGTWTTGYAATMYGNDSSGDCAGYPSFSDTTSINSQTCTTGQNKVTIGSYSSGVNNNASYYGATGDLSSLWSGATCTCNGSDTCNNQSPSCPAESQTGGNCGICVAVKCDPNGTFSLSGSTHDADCSKTEYAVVQIIDACPHNHPTNVASSEGWCTSRQANHIDLSCSALGGISTKGMNIGQDGWLNVDVQKVDCSIGLGLHAL